MFGSDILEVAIGMVFLYLFMSMIASALREAFEALLQQRSAFLERGLKEMLRTGHATTWIAEFYNHPMISSLYRGTYGSCSKLPAYIPKQSFSLAILDMVAGASAAGKTLSIPDLAQTLKDSGAPNDVQRVVLMALSAAGNDVAAVRKHLEDWYDATMTRVSGWYAKRSAAFLFAFGLGAAVALNVDSITIAKSLIVDKPLRQAIVAQAEKYVGDPANRPRSSAETGNPSTSAPPANPAGADTTSGGASTARKTSFDDLRTEFAEIGYPIGWTFDGGLYPSPQACRHTASANGDIKTECTLKGGELWGVWLLAIMGWLITAIAIMLGAPFWFDLLNKLVSLRSTLKPIEAPSAGNQKKPAEPASPSDAV